MAMSTPNPGSDKRTKENLWITLPAEGRLGSAPKLSLPAQITKDFEGDQRAAKRSARALWAKWWASPMATMWSTDDAPSLTRLLIMITRAGETGGSSAELGEIRQLEDRFGLNPRARRSLFWRIEGIDVPSVKATDLGHSRPVAPVAGGDNDPRLRVIRGGKVG